MKREIVDYILRNVIDRRLGIDRRAVIESVIESGETKLGIEWHEVTGYVTGFSAWAYKHLPASYDGWTDLMAFSIVTVTFIFITLPKAWDFQKARWKKR